jgi:hypothetical protein
MITAKDILFAWLDVDIRVSVATTTTHSREVSITL